MAVWHLSVLCRAHLAQVPSPVMISTLSSANAGVARDKRKSPTAPARRELVYRFIGWVVVGCESLITQANFRMNIVKGFFCELTWEFRVGFDYGLQARFGNLEGVSNARWMLMAHPGVSLFRGSERLDSRPYYLRKIRISRVRTMLIMRQVTMG